MLAQKSPCEPHCGCSTHEQAATVTTEAIDLHAKETAYPVRDVRLRRTLQLPQRY